MKKLWMAAVGAVALLASCTTETPTSGEPDTDGVITVWTLEDVQDRIDKTKGMAEAYAAENDIEVEVVPIAEDQFDQVLTAAAAEGTLPDVVAALSLAGVQNLQVNELLNTEMSADVVETLEAETFSESALALTRDGDTQLGVPSDAWAQLLLYRTDLFEDAGLEPPTSWQALEAAASALNSDDVAGIVISTTPETGSPSRASSIWRCRTVVSSSTTPARSPWTVRSA